MSLSDEECVRLCLDGQREVFRHLVVKYQVPVAKYLSGKLRNENAASEATQETLVRAFFALGKLRNPAAFFSWLLGIADRVAKETSRSRQREVPSLEIEEVSEPVSDTAADDVHSDWALRHAIAELPDAQRQVILLRFYAGLSCTEIGRSLDVPLGTVTSRLSRAYALLRSALRSPQLQALNPEAEL
jgi:RNA polymerase sigma-70 factor (ECF subfamily)